MTSFGYALARAELIRALTSGVATAGTNTTLDDTHKSWTANMWQGGVIRIIKRVGTEYFRDISANTDTQITFAALPIGVTVEAGDLYLIKNVDLAILSKLQRWGRNVDPTWTHAAEVVAPAAGTALVTQAVTAGMAGYIYGFFIACTEANSFLINWTSATVAYSKRMVFGAGGSMEAIDQIPFNEGLPADAGSNITITNVVAGAAAQVYQACLLYAEV